MPLDILLTNDDGYGSPGIMAVREALEQVGHDVTVVAPSTNQSGVGMRLHYYGDLTATQVAPDAWRVSGTPADCVMFALREVMATDPPDLVISGANFGENVGPGVSYSGTVGAAMTALRVDIPAIAISTEHDRSLGEDATMRAFPRTADFLTELVEALRQRPGGRLLTNGVILNVNMPVFRPEESVEGTALTVLGAERSFRLEYRETGDGTYKIIPSGIDEKETRRRADTTALEHDKISITPMDGDWTAPRHDTGQLHAVLHTMGDYGSEREDGEEEEADREHWRD